MIMLVLSDSGRERTETEYEAIFERVNQFVQRVGFLLDVGRHHVTDAVAADDRHISRAQPLRYRRMHARRGLSEVPCSFLPYPLPTPGSRSDWAWAV